MQRDHVERAVGALAAFWRELGDRAPAGARHELGGVSCITSGVPVPAFNGVWGFDADADAETVLAGVDAFRGGPVPWNLQLRPGYPPELDEELARRGLVVTAQIPLMLLTGLDRLPQDGDVAVREMVTFHDADVVFGLLEQAFGMPSELTREAMPLLMFFLLDARTWIATAADGTDVSTALGVATGGVVGVYNVATPAEHRGKGYGAFITAEAIRRAWDQGCDLAYLQSSPMGYRVYERLGFTTAERWTQWMPAEYVG